MKVLLVGGAGYIGSHTALALARHGHQIVIFDNLSTGYRSFTKGFELITGDVRDRDALFSVLPGIGGIIHLAAHAYVGESVRHPRKYFDNNVVGGLTLLNAAVDFGVRHLVFSSSCAVYGEVSRIPIDEATPRQPINAYGMSKLFLENALSAYDAAYDLRSVCLRYFNAAGADETGRIGELHDPETHLIPLAIAAAHRRGPPLQVFGDNYPTNDGTCVRDYVHVNDLAEAHVRALEYLAEGGESIAVNLGTGHGRSIRALLAKIAEISGREVPYQIVSRRAGDPATLVADVSLAKQVLGWEATRSFDDIVRTAWAWSEFSQGANVESTT
jgi:UDP-glucose 4-epimerase